MPKADRMHVSFRSLKFIAPFVGLLWIAILILVYQQLVDQHKHLDRIAAPIKHRSVVLDSVHCVEQSVDISDRECAKRLRYLVLNKQRDACFVKHGVPENASRCAILKYLIYVERKCPEPKFANSLFTHLMETNEKSELLERTKLTSAKCRSDVDELVQKMENCGEACRWMKTRIQNTWRDWIDVIVKMAQEKNMEIDEGRITFNASDKYAKRRQLTIVIHMGLLTKEFGLNFGEGAFAGGPLGELVQWSDLASALHVLGHTVILSWSPERLSQILKKDYSNPALCRKPVIADIIFTDLTGLEQIRNTLGTLYHYRCRLRILDVYGTEPEFNHPKYNNDRSGARTWGGKGLDPQQFFTHFPHSSDNSFLGFAIPEVNKKFGVVNENQALLYGKNVKSIYEPGVVNFLQILHRHFPEIHATMRLRPKSETSSEDASLTSFIVNHGPLSQEEFTVLLQSSRLFIGLGLPVEGPAALEAVANGVTFLNPKFSPPRYFHEGKPTSRRLTSQNPYAEDFIGEPHVYTVNIGKQVEVDAILKKITALPRPKPKVNYEFTYGGFLERVNAYLENQDFCHSQLDSDVTTGLTWKRKNDIWPPKTSLRIKESTKDESCIATCSRHNLTCERAFFPLINNLDSFKEINRECSSSEYIPNRMIQLDAKRSAANLCHAPSHDLLTGSCALQSDTLLYSCACVSPSSVVRLCPCRTYRREQIALCDTCI